MLSSNRQIKKGIALSYFIIVVNSLSNIILTPVLISSVGQGEYGVFQTINAFASNLVVIDIGTGTMMTRFLSIYLAEKNKKEVNNFSAIGILLSAICAVASLFIGFLMYLSIDSVYANTFSDTDLETAKCLFILMIFSVSISMLDKAFLGIINAYERFTVTKGTVLLKILFRIISILGIVLMKGSVIWISITELVIAIITVILMFSYVVFKLGVHPHFYHLDKKIILSSSTFMIAIVFNSVVNQVNLSLDKILIGSIVSTTAVTVYQVGLVIVNANNQIANSASNIFLPKITKSLHNGVSMDKIVDIAVPPGRLNYIITGIIFVEFTLFGKEFLTIWMHDTGYEQVYWEALMLLVAYLIPHMEIATGSILDAMNKRIVRSIVLGGIALVNGITTALILPYYGILGAAFMTMITVLFGHGIILNIYFKKRLEINVWRMLVQIIHGITPCLFISALVGLPFVSLDLGILGFIIKCIVVLLVFLVLMFKFGFNNSEKTLISNFIIKIKSYLKRDAS